MSGAIDHIIVPVDASRHAALAVRHAECVASALGKDLHFLHVFPASPDTIAGPGAGLSDLATAELLDQQKFETLREQVAARAFRQAREALGETEVPVQEVSRAGDPAEGIIRYAEELPDSMIIMGARGLGRVGELLLGSVSHRVVHHAPCPVTIVK